MDALLAVIAFTDVFNADKLRTETLNMDALFTDKLNIDALIIDTFVADKFVKLFVVELKFATIPSRFKVIPVRPLRPPKLTVLLLVEVSIFVVAVLVVEVKKLTT